MKKLILTVAIASVFAACGSTGGAGSIKTDNDSLAYAIGVDLGRNIAPGIKQVDSTLNVDILVAAFRDAIDGKAQMDEEATTAFLRDYFMVRVPAKAKAASEEFLAEVEAKGGNIKKTESGLLYEVILEGDKSLTPKITDRVKAVYEGKLSNGDVFDSSKGEAIEFALNGVIAGWGEGLQLIGKGGKIKLWIPSDIAYGPQGRAPKIGPNAALEFEVELVDVIPTTEK